MKMKYDCVFPRRMNNYDTIRRLLCHCSAVNSLSVQHGMFHLTYVLYISMFKESELLYKKYIFAQMVILFHVLSVCFPVCVLGPPIGCLTCSAKRSLLVMTSILHYLDLISDFET